LLGVALFKRGELDSKVNEWDSLKAKLEKAAWDVLRSTDYKTLIAAKNTFEDALIEFCAATVPMNREFLGNVLRHLQNIVLKPAGKSEEIRPPQ
jgi:hypothetical protein